MMVRGILTTTLALAVLLGTAACSSDDAGSAQPSRSTASTSPSSTTGSGSVSARPAVRLLGPKMHGVRATECLLAGHGEFNQDYLMSGIRLGTTARATLTRVTPGGHGVQIVGAWAVPTVKPNTGAIVPWSVGQKTFLSKLPWRARERLHGATLEADDRYTLVLRVRPRVPSQITSLEIDYRGEDGPGSVQTHDLLEFQRRC